MLLFEKYGQHQPLICQAERFASEGGPLSTWTMADQVGAVAFALTPLFLLIQAHVLAAERLHGDDTTVPVIAKGKINTVRLWTYVRDDRPFAGSDPPTALFHYSRDRRGGHPRAHLASWSAILQADAYSGYSELYAEGRQLGPIIEAGCFAHRRRKFFELADIAAAARFRSRSERTGMIYSIALEAVQRIDAMFDIERGINGKSVAERLAIRHELSAPVMAEFDTWLTSQLARLSRNHDLAKAFTCFLENGRTCLTNNAAERALRRLPLGQKAWLFCGADPGVTAQVVGTEADLASAKRPSTKSRIALSADWPERRAVPVTDRYPAWICAPHSDLKPLVTLRKTTEGRISRSEMLFVAITSRFVRKTKNFPRYAAICLSRTLPAG
jgi:transposase